MFIENPELTLEEEAHDLPEGASKTALLLYAFSLNVHGDDGRQYWIDSMAARAGSTPLGPIDMWSIAVRLEKGKVVQSPGSVYKIAEFPPVTTMAFQPFPSGALTIKRSGNEVTVDMENYHLVCKDDKTWHVSMEDKEQGIKGEWVHTGVGFPWRYGKEKPQAFTPHTVLSGYCWSGTVEGMLTIEGRKVRIKGKGVREHFYPMDFCDAEAGWEDWIWFHFDEMFGGVTEMKLNKHKDMSLYLVREKQLLPAGSFNIEHHDWAYLRSAGVFIPTRYKVTIETEAGVLEIATNVVGCYVVATSGEVPDIPLIMLGYEKLDGIFTYKDGHKRTLTNGLGGNAIKLWKPYPAIFIPEISGA